MKVNLYYDKHDDNYYFRLNNKRVIIDIEEFIFLMRVFDLFSNYKDYLNELDEKNKEKDLKEIEIILRRGIKE